jgi:hypothetical protein
MEEGGENFQFPAKLDFQKFSFLLNLYEAIHSQLCPLFIAIPTHNACAYIKPDLKLQHE